MSRNKTKKKKTEHQKQQHDSISFFNIFSSTMNRVSQLYNSVSHGKLLVAAAAVTVLIAWGLVKGMGMAGGENGMNEENGITEFTDPFDQLTIHPVESAIHQFANNQLDAGVDWEDDLTSDSSEIHYTTCRDIIKNKIELGPDIIKRESKERQDQIMKNTIEASYRAFKNAPEKGMIKKMIEFVLLTPALIITQEGQYLESKIVVNTQEMLDAKTAKNVAGYYNNTENAVHILVPQGKGLQDYWAEIIRHEAIHNFVTVTNYYKYGDSFIHYLICVYEIECDEFIDAYHLDLKSFSSTEITVPSGENFFKQVFYSLSGKSNLLGKKSPREFIMAVNDDTARGIGFEMSSSPENSNYFYAENVWCYPQMHCRFLLLSKSTIDDNYTPEELRKDLKMIGDDLNDIVVNGRYERLHGRKVSKRVVASELIAQAAGGFGSLFCDLHPKLCDKVEQSVKKVLSGIRFDGSRLRFDGEARCVDDDGEVHTNNYWTP